MRNNLMFYHVAALALSIFSLNSAYSDSLCTLEKGYRIYNKSDSVRNNSSTGSNNIKTICVGDLISVKIKGKKISRQEVTIKNKSQYISSKGILKKGDDLHSNKFRMYKGAPLLNNSKDSKRSAHFTGGKTSVEYAKVFLDENKKPIVQNKRVKSLIVQHISGSRWLIKSGWTRLSSFRSDINKLIKEVSPIPVRQEENVKVVKKDIIPMVETPKTYKEMYVCPTHLGDKTPVFSSSLSEIIDNLRAFESVNVIESEKKDTAVIDGEEKIFSIIDFDDSERKIESKRIVSDKSNCNPKEKTTPVMRSSFKSFYVCTNDGGGLNAHDDNFEVKVKISNESKVTQVSNDTKLKNKYSYIKVNHNSKHVWVAKEFLAKSLNSCPSAAQNKKYICTKSGDPLSIRSSSFKLITKLNQLSPIQQISSEVKQHKGLDYINISYGRKRTGWVAKKYTNKNKESCAKPENSGISGIKFRTNRGLIRMHNGRAGFCGSVDYSPERGGESYASAVTACTLTRFAQEWKTKHCPRGGACKMTIGDISHRTALKFDGHNTHTDGNCIDFRPIRKYGSGPLTYRHKAYSRAKTKEFLRLARKLGATDVYFNDPRVRKSGLSGYAGGHDNHVHLCFHNNKRVRNSCAAYKPNYNVCPKAQSLFETKFMKKRIGRK